MGVEVVATGAAEEAAVGAGAAAELEAAAGAGAGARSMVAKRIWPVLASREEHLAPALVTTLCSSTKSVGLFSLMTAKVPSAPCELKASMVAGLNSAESQPRPVGREVMILPSAAFKTRQLLWPRQ